MSGNAMPSHLVKRGEMAKSAVTGGAGSIEASEVEVREDEEQKLKLQEIIDLLVAAGYFRARIKGLSSFDKVVGGMTWCVETCNFEVDVDLLFQENLTIGQRISLTEKIVAVLPAMQCPHGLEPHQIQGLDFIHIFPVIQWLVKCSLETRQQMGEVVRGYAVRQFGCWLQAVWPGEGVPPGLLAVRDLYRPRRLLCRRDRLQALATEDSATLVQATLLEYGGGGVRNAADHTATSEDGSSHGMPRVLNTEEVRLAPALVGSIVSLQAQEIAAAAQRYTQLQGHRQEGEQWAPGTGQAQALQRCAVQLRAERGSLQQVLAAGQKRAAAVREACAQLVAGAGQPMASPHQGALQQLQRLVQLQEGLRAQEQQFREQCRSQLAQLQAQVQAQRAGAGAGSPVDGATGAGPLVEETARVQRLRLALARRTRAAALLQRQLDEVPGRAELAQYQRRFLELYNQVAAKHKETKQFYTMYNTLDDTKLYASKELSLLNSILDNYSEAMASTAGKEQFMQQFDAIVEGIQQNKAKAEWRRAEERQRRDWLGKQLQALVEQQRQYVSAVRHLTLECGRSERLLAQLRGCC